MKYIVVWFPSIGIMFLRNFIATFFLGKSGWFADYIFGRACSWSSGMTCGAGIIVSAAFVLSAVIFIGMAVADIYGVARRRSPAPQEETR